MAGPAPEVAAGYVPPVFSLRQQWVAAIVFAFSNFMVVLDMTIANVSVPHIAGDLGITMDQGTWIITSYAVAEAICVPLTGWLSTRFGVARVFVACMAGFGLFSLACGLSPTLGVLVFARIGQGLFGAPIMPMSQTLMMIVIEPRNRPKMMAIWAMTTMTGPAFGPLVGGYISDNWSWHWIFLINVPIAATLVAVGGLLMRQVRTPTARKPIDAIGLALLVFWIGALQIVLDTGRERDWFADTRTLLLAITAALGFVAFIVWELTDEHPIVDLSLFRHKGFSASIWAMTIGFGAFFSGNVVSPQWLQAYMGYSAQNSGIITGCHAFASMTVAALAQRAAARFDARKVASFGLLWIGTATLLRANWTTQESLWQLALPIFLAGFGMPFFFITTNQIAISSVDRHELASAAGLQAFARTIAVAITTSVVLTIWGNQQRVARTDLAGSVNPGDTIDRLGQAGVPFEGARATINNLVEQQAVTLAMNHTTVIAALMVFSSIVVMWFGPRPDVSRVMGPRK